ncbi:hypothetical protein OS493_030924 [Desmophyllum pertusum]|uniref:Uncharacterized protein n=1 Tax=Desmophyllum pertusum TaxID=174260 RepID=A0A9W9ZYJ4_9CNID|nr:hypothetical protein OS493_030924 [Desmophyllum pertusum]
MDSDEREDATTASFFRRFLTAFDGAAFDEAELIMTTDSSNLEELDKEQPDGPFSCPVCKVAVNPGKDADTACDENIRNEICSAEEDVKDPVCMLYKIFSGSQVEFIERHCYSREGYNRVKGYCDKPGKNCALAMCDNSGCKAELITTNAGIEGRYRG